MKCEWLGSPARSLHTDIKSAGCRWCRNTHTHTHTHTRARTRIGWRSRSADTKRSDTAASDIDCTLPRQRRRRRLSDAVLMLQRASVCPAAAVCVLTTTAAAAAAAAGGGISQHPLVTRSYCPPSRSWRASTSCSLGAERTASSRRSAADRRRILTIASERRSHKMSARTAYLPRFGIRDGLLVLRIAGLVVMVACLGSEMCKPHVVILCITMYLVFSISFSVFLFLLVCHFLFIFFGGQLWWASASTGNQSLFTPFIGK